MEFNRKTEISIQQIKRRVVLLPETEVVLSCPNCETGENMIIAEQTASVSGFSRREIYRMVEESLLHFVETEEGILYICLKSLENNLTENNKDI